MGLVMQDESYTLAEFPQQGVRGLFNGKELQTFADLNFYDYHWRQYDPQLGRWHSPDPADQFYGISGYAYCANNPVMLTDPDGRVVWFVAAAVIVGGVLNLASNWDNIQGDPLKALGYFAAGGISGGLSTLGPIGGMAGGFINGSLNTALGGGGLGDVFKNGVIGSISGLAGGYASQASNIVINGISLKIGSPLLDGIIKGAAGGAVGGATSGGISSSLSGGDFFEGAWNGLKMGVVVGGVTGGALETFKALTGGVNPITGNMPRKGSTGKIGDFGLEQAGFDTKQFQMQTPDGGRRFDGFKVRNGIMTVAEAKVGLVKANGFQMKQFDKTDFLLGSKPTLKLEYHLFRSPATGLRGITPQIHQRIMQQQQYFPGRVKIIHRRW
jgi:RHS repeat-associated protein